MKTANRTETAREREMTSAYRHSSRVRARMAAAAIAGVAAFGLAFVVLPSWTESFFNWLIFGSGDSPASFSAQAQDYLRFVYGVLGAVIVGWMILAALVLTKPGHTGAAAANTILISLGVWFVVDTTHSLATSYPENAALNVVFALALGAPLLLLARRDAAS